MILIDTALEKREQEGRPVRVALVGAGYMGRGIAFPMLTGMRGMRLVAISNRTISEAERAYRDAGVEAVRTIASASELDEAIAARQFAITDNPFALCEAQQVDVVIESTGEVEFGAHVVTRAIASRKHVVLMNAELDATVGPLLKIYADRAGVVITNADGDQPGVIMNLYRFVRTIGFRPVLAGNSKGLQDPYRTPETQRGFAEKYHQKPRMVTSFADGTKISMEMAIVANATGHRAGRRGMYGPRATHFKDALTLFPMDELLNGGLVDYLLGAEPSPGVFVLGYEERPIPRRYMTYHKMGDGPLYVFYTPYHLCNFEVPLTAARAVLFNDAAIAPLGGPVCEVMTLAKRDLRAGETLDGIGGFTCYGVLENRAPFHEGGFLPMGLAEGCRLQRDLRRDEPITYADVAVPPDRLVDRLRSEQERLFAGQSPDAITKSAPTAPSSLLTAIADSNRRVND
jgi:predicted homoserine dehydrogenase-like protein